MVGDRDKALVAGCDGYVAKPIHLQDFLAVVKSFIGEGDGVG